MFQLYQKRTFSSYMSDTIAFFRGYWKNFFGNYIVIAGGMIFVLCIFFFFIFRDMFSAMFSTENQGIGYDIGYYFSDNSGLFFALLAVAIILGLFLTIISMAYPIAYMQLMENTGKDKFTASEIFEQLKRYLPKLIKFALFSIGVMFPLITLAVVISAVLIIIVIGIFLLLLLIPVSMALYSQMLFFYLHDDLGLFESLRTALRMLFSKKNFWPIIGSTAATYFIISIIESAISMIPYLVIMIGIVLSANDETKGSNLTILMAGLYIVSIALSYIFYNVLMINQGLIFYSSKEQAEHTQAFSEIDLIGQNAE
ncbi:MAG: hypothetical protein LBR48_03745 [Dysgonamonadaceae bacterium]|nr:hypothetical protein [Dysgonamonadaceae bacterium]